MAQANQHSSGIPPSFAVHQFRSHRRAQSDANSRMSTGFRATEDARSKIHSRIDPVAPPSTNTNTNTKQSLRMGRSTSMISSSKRKPAPTPVMVREQGEARDRSSSPLTVGGLRSAAAALGLPQLSASSSSSLSNKSGSVTDASTAAASTNTNGDLSARGPHPAPSPTNVATTTKNRANRITGRFGLNKGQDAPPSVDSLDMPSLEKKRPPKELMQAYSEGFYGLALSLSDSALVSSGDEDEDDSDDYEEDDRDSITDMDSKHLDNDEIGQEVRNLIRATNRAFFSVDTGLDAPLGSESLRRSQEARSSQDSRNSATARKPLRSGSPSSPFNNPESSHTGSEGSPNTASPPSPAPEKPNLTSHWSESTIASRHSTLGISHGATAPLSPLRSGPQFIKTTKKKRRSPSSGTASKFGRVGTGKGSRWGLSEGVHDILTGQRFKKPEVEEFLTPEKMAQLKKPKNGKKDSKEVEAADDEQSQSRPQSAQSQGPAANVGRSSPSPSKLWRATKPAETPLKTTTMAEFKKYETPAEEALVVEAKDDAPNNQRQRSPSEDRQKQPSPEPLVHGAKELPASVSNDTSSGSDADKSPSLRAVTSNGKTVSSKSSFESEKNEGLGNPEDDSDTSASSPPPTPPAKNPSRVPLSDKRNAPLPDLPADADDGEDDENIYLKSTPFTLTKPSFKHGPITFSKAELGRAALTADDTMDWTAFQMAILGGAGELAPEDLDDEDVEFGEELSQWFEAFEMGPGKLIKYVSPTVGSSDDPGSSRSSLSSRSGSIGSDENLPIPCATEDMHDRDLGFDEVRFFRRQELKKWDGHGTCSSSNNANLRPASLNVPSKVKARKVAAEVKRRGTAIDHLRRKEQDSSGSYGLDMGLPGSKMSARRVVVVGEEEGDGEQAETAKMGFNLTSDLGDYLRWEQEHLNGGGF